MADMLITVPDSVLNKLRNNSIRTTEVSIALENAVQKGMVLPEEIMPLIISAIGKYEAIRNLARITDTPIKEVAQKMEQLEADLVIPEFHCGFEESGGHAYNCNDCPNKCEEWHQWDKKFKEKGDEDD